MKHEKMRIAKITDEIINFLYSIGAKEITINLKELDDEYQMLYKSDYENISKKKLDQMIHTCKRCKKRNEMEEFYWELLGEDDGTAELSLVRMMIDKITIDIEDDHLEMKLIRKKD